MHRESSHRHILKHVHKYKTRTVFHNGRHQLSTLFILFPTSIYCFFSNLTAWLMQVLMLCCSLPHNHCTSALQHKHNVPFLERVCLGEGLSLTQAEGSHWPVTPNWNREICDISQIPHFCTVVHCFRCLNNAVWKKNPNLINWVHKNSRHDYLLVQETL